MFLVPFYYHTTVCCHITIVAAALPDVLGLRPGSCDVSEAGKP